MTQKNRKKIGETAGAVLLLLLGALILAAAAAKAEKTHRSRDIQEEIAGQIIRFHVLANSDSREDQALKLKVKEKTADYVRGILADAEEVSQARRIIREHLFDIEARARRAIREEGYDYLVRVVLEPCYFPVRVYGDMTFPEGEYEALRVLIGEAKGRNWWCVMFPSLCFVNEACQTVPEESKRELKAVLSEQDYDSLLSGGNGKIKFRFKLADWWNKIVKTG